MDIEKIEVELQNFLAEQTSPLLIKLLINGLPVVITYQSGLLQEITMIDEGKLGLDITKAVRVSRDLPERIPFNGVLKVQANVILTFSDFEKMNQKGEYLDHKDLTRKVIGTQMDIEQKKLRVIVSEIAEIRSEPINSEMNWKEFLLHQGFKVVYHERINNSSEEIIRYYKTFLEFHREEIGYSVSGLQIIPTDSSNSDEKFIMPFPPDEVSLKVEDISPEIHSNGKIIFVLKIKADDLAGQRHFSLYLSDFTLIKSMDIRVGDRIYMEDVRTITGVDIGNRTGRELPYTPPDACPKCGDTIKIDSGEFYCVHPDCRDGSDPYQQENNGVKGMTFVITGTLSTRRYEFRKLIEESGGELAGVVTKRIDYLIVGAKGIGTVKYRKAQSLNIPMISEEQFRMMIK